MAEDKTTTTTTETEKEAPKIVETTETKKVETPVPANPPVVTEWRPSHD